MNNHSSSELCWHWQGLFAMAWIAVVDASDALSLNESAMLQQLHGSCKLWPCAQCCGSCTIGAVVAHAGVGAVVGGKTIFHAMVLLMWAVTACAKHKVYKASALRAWCEWIHEQQQAAAVCSLSCCPCKPATADVKTSLKDFCRQGGPCGTSRFCRILR
jgi:hypothetical protein